jgi:transposase
LLVIADKGFGSEDNFALLEKSELLYVVSLRRNSSLFSKDRLMSGDKSVFEGFLCLMSVQCGIMGVGVCLFIWIVL